MVAATTALVGHTAAADQLGDTGTGPLRRLTAEHDVAMAADHEAGS